MSTNKKEIVLISSCLLGEPCRWHGKTVPISSFVKRFLKDNPNVEVIEACPETLGGLTVPRAPVKRRKDRVWITCAEKAKRKEVTGEELTREFVKGAKATLKIALKNNVKRAILCQWSPSCDKKGITGKLLIENGIEVINTF